MFNLRLGNAAIIRYSQLKFGHMYLCGMDYKYFSPHCCKCNSFGCTAAIRWGNACHGPHSDSLYSGSEHSHFNSPRLVKREAGFPNPRRALIGSNQLWRVNDSPCYREFQGFQFQFHFQFHQFQFQFRNWNWNWAAIPIPELNWPQPWGPWGNRPLLEAVLIQIFSLLLTIWCH